MPRPNSNIEANIAKYFITAPLATANVVFGIIRATMKDRNDAVANTTAAKSKPVKLRKRRTKAQMLAAKALHTAVAGSAAAETSVPGPATA
jgi:hypothetical protein